MVVFKEILPNPSGKDTDGEWIKIINTGDKSIQLSGWTISDESGRIFTFSKLKNENQSISKNEELILPYSVTKISLNNNREKLDLLNSNGEIEDSISYNKSISDNQVVFGKEFTPTETTAQASIGDIEEYSINEGMLFRDELNLSPILIGVLIAVVSGVGVSVLIRHLIKDI